MDIRKYFGNQAGSTKKSALSELRETKGSPVPNKIQHKPAPVKKDQVLLNDESDGEEPVSRSVRNVCKAKTKRTRIVISSDEDDFVESASTVRTRKRGERIIFEAPEPSHVGGETRLINKRKNDKSQKISSKEDVNGGISSEQSSEDDSFVKARPRKKGKFIKLSPNQSLLQLKKAPREVDNTRAGTSSHRKEKKFTNLNKIDEVEFFDTFGKFSKTRGVEKKQLMPSKDDEDLQVVPRKKVRREAESARKEKKESADDSKYTPATSSKVSLIKETEENLDQEICSKKRKLIAYKDSNTTNSAPSIPKKLSSEKKVVKNVSKNIKKQESPEREVKTKNLLQDVEENLPWVDKYKPKCLSDLVGQRGEKSPMNKLLAWLRGWYRLHLGELAQKKKPRPPPWMSQSDGSSFKAVLLSGVPGVGKTSCATLACKELDLHYVEMNASEVRNKKVLEAKTAELIGCHVKQKELTHVLIMDEVDGMSGNEDRAGVSFFSSKHLAELIQLIKNTCIPIICICNDRQSPKMRTLVNYCYDIRFQRPRVEQIRDRLHTILSGEKLKVSSEQLDKLMEAANHDVRQCIYSLQLLSYGAVGEIQAKDCAVNTFEAARRLLSPKMSLYEKQQMFFTDYMLMPLFVQENYLNMRSEVSKKERLHAIKQAADSISLGDIVEKSIRSCGNWSLLNTQCMLSSVLPPFYMGGHLKAMINFPSLLGKTSTTNKRCRLLQQISMHSFSRISTSSAAMAMDYVHYLRDKLFFPLVEHESEGVSGVVEVYKEYDLLKSDADAISELSVWPNIKNPVAKVLPKVKAALTRALNKEHRLLPYATDEISKKRGKAKETELQVDEEGKLIEFADDDGDAASSENDDDGDMPVVKVTKGASASTSNRGGARGGKSARGNATARGRRGGKK